MFKKLITFYQKGMWQTHASKLPFWKALGIRTLRVISLTSQGFIKNEITQGASALTFYSLLAVVPIVALLIGIARGFQFEQNLEAFLLERFSEQRLIIEQIFKFANASLQEVKGGLIAGIGIVILAWSTIEILTNIELVFNEIWDVAKGRSFKKRFTDYFSMIFLAPVLILLATGVSGYLSARATGLHKGEFLDHFTVVILPLLSFLSFLLVCFAFVFLYMLMPNTRVKFLPALIAGFFAGVVYQLLQWLYLYFQVGVARYNAIYGTFAALPLFLIWLNLSWLVTLLGAKMSYAIQNADSYEFLPPEDVELSPKTKTIATLRIAHLCIKNFSQEHKAPTIQNISNQLFIPPLLAHQLTDQLVNAGVLSVIKTDDSDEVLFQPAINIDHLTIKRVLDMINAKGASIPLPSSEESTLILKSLEKFSHAIEDCDGNIPLKNI